VERVRYRDHRILVDDEFADMSAAAEAVIADPHESQCPDRDRAAFMPRGPGYALTQVSGDARDVGREAVTGTSDRGRRKQHPEHQGAREHSLHVAINL
jgi:hypothetical protein